MKTQAIALLLAGWLGAANAAPLFAGGIAIPGALGDFSGTAVNDGRVGFFSDLYYDPARNEWWALSDRGPGGGTIPYETRVERFTLDIDPLSGAISNFRVAKTVKFKRGGVAFNGIAPKPKSVLGQSHDPEGFVVAPGSGHFYVSDEYGPSVHEFDRKGVMLRAFQTPANMLPRDALGQRNFADDKGNVAGRRSNRGFEGLAITPDGKFVFAILQSAMLDEGGKDGAVSRIVKFDTVTGKAVAQYAYAMDSAGQGRGVSALVAFNDHQFLALERNNRGVGVDATLTPPVKRVYKIDLDGASDVSAITLSPTAAYKPVSKSLWLDMSADTIAALGGKVPEKIEGLAFGPKLQDGSTFLLAGTDNDYSVTQNDTGTQLDVYFNMADTDPDATAIHCPLEKTTGCVRADGTAIALPPGYALLPGVLYAYKVPAADMMGYVIREP